MESRQHANNYQENKRFLSRIYNSKEEFHKQYEKIYSDKAKAKLLYLQLLSEIRKSILIDDVESFGRFSNLLYCITESEDHTNLKSFYNDDANVLNVCKSTNFLIFVSKCNSLNIMKYVLDNNTIINKISLNRSTPLIPEEKDDAGHTAFYYALRSNNIELADILIHKWPGNYFVYNLEKIDVILSEVCEELKLKNVLLSKEMELYVEDKIIHLRFYPDKSTSVPNSPKINSLCNIKERIRIVLENISSLKEISEVSDRFLFIIKFIAQNVSILKRQLRSTYDRLPWEEIEFCLISFISAHIKKQEINLFYQVTLNKNTILKHLANFAEKLEDLYNSLDSFDLKELAILPKVNRDYNVAKITESSPQFRELYEGYHKIRDIHSLEKINTYVQLAAHANPNERQGQLTIIRSLQVIGEYLKNTLESPKLSNFTSELLLLSLPNNTRKAFINIRNSLSLVYAVTKRIEIEENEDVEYFVGVQKDIKNINCIITYILYKNKIKTIKILLQRIIDSSDLEELKEVARLFHTFELEAIDSKNLNTMEQEMLEKLIKQLRDNVTEKSNDEAQLLKKMHDIIAYEKNKLKNIEKDYFVGARMLSILYQGLLEDNIDQIDIKTAKFYADMTLQNMTSRIETNCLRQLAELAVEISRTNKLKVKCENLVEINRLTCEIIYIAKLEVESIKWIEKLKGKLNSCSIGDESRQSCNYILTDEEKRAQLTSKLVELQNILNASLANDQLQFPMSESDEKLLAVLEMLILDILTILGSSRGLEKNLLFLDESTPTLIGKCLRNHLAHDNLLVDLVLSDPSLTVFLNAKKLILENVAENDKRIGKFVQEDPVRFRNRYNRALEIIGSQEKLFAALEEGNIEAVKACIASGAEIFGRNVDKWTALHFAVKGSNLELVKFVLEQNLSVDAKNDLEQSALHVAAMYGNRSIVQFLVKDKCLGINEIDREGRTPLHYAAKAGHKDVVEMLIKFKANHAIKDKSGYSALHYATRNNHKEVVFILINKEINADVNEAFGGYTSLHLASDKGHLELVQYFLKLKANVFAKTDRGTTPLHLAAHKGHLEVAKLLVARGSNVNARAKDGATPLHFAVEYGYTELTEMLLKQGAEPNVYYNHTLYTPLHYAAQDGRLEIVNALLKKGAKPSPVAASSLTPLHLAIKSGHFQTVDMFAKQGVSVRADPFLHVAVEYGHRELVEFLLEQQADVNSLFVNDVRPLHVAAACGRKEIAERLVAHRAVVDARDVNGFSALHAAVDKGQRELVELLLRLGADVNARTKTNTTALHIAATNGDTDIIDLLIKNKANVNASDCDRVRPLHLAAQHGHVNILNSLINNAAEINMKHNFGSTALQMAVEAGCREAVEILIANEAAVNTRNKYGCTVLSSAVKCNAYDIAELLINHGADVNAEDGQPLLYAVLSGFDDMVRLLLKHKARIDLTYSDGNSLLHLAVIRSYKRVVDVLLAGGVKINARNRNDVMPLHIAVKISHEEIVQTLLEHKADLVARIQDGLTTLHIAACEGDVGVLEALLRHGIDVNVRDDMNRTALELAITCGSFKVVKVLFNRSKVNINQCGVSHGNFTFLHIAANVGDVEIGKYLMNNGANIHAQDVFGSKPMHIAAKMGHRDFVEIFVKLGLSVDEPGRNEQTPLHYAALAGQAEVAEYLISQGADLNARDSRDATPMHMASISGYRHMVALLMEKGAMYNPVDGQRQRPAELTDNKDIVELLEATERLFKAVKQNNALEVQQCIKARGFVNAKSFDNVSPLHHAAWKGHDELVNILLQNGANPNAVGKQGLTPLHYAAKFGHLKVLKSLLANGAIYNAVSEAGKTPLDIAEDKSVVNLLRLVSESFEHVVSCNPKVVGDIRKLKDVETVKAVMGTVNTANKSLITLAIHSGFPKVGQLKQIMQDDLCDNIESAENLIQQEKYEEALKVFEKVLKKRCEILGPNNPGTLDIQSRMAKILYKQHKYQEALSMLEEIYSKQNVVLGTSVKDTLSTKSTIALIMHRQGKSEEALRIYEEVYTKQRETAGVPEADILSTRFHMAVVLEGLGRYEDALVMFNEILEKQKKTMGMRDPDTVTTLNNIAALLDRTGKSDEALKVYRKVYETRKMILGPTHSDTFKTSFNMIAVLVHQEKFSEALEAYEELLETQKTILGPCHIYTLNTWQNIAQIYIYQSRYVSALKIMSSCIGPRKEILGAKHPDIIRTEQIIKQIYYELRLDGRLEDYVLQTFEGEMKLAVDGGDARSVEYLLRNIIDVNDQDVDGRTLLHFAVDLGHADIVSMLLRCGALVTKATNKGNTPLHTATSRGRKDIVDVLLRQVSRDKLTDFVNARTSANGTAALHVAARNGHYDILKTLLKHGAVYDIGNNEGKRPIDFTKDARTLALLESIDEMFARARRGDEKLIERLRSAKPDEFKAMTNTRDHQDRSIVQSALVNKHPQLASKLLKLLKTSNSN